jgi:hypothetical protein
MNVEAHFELMILAAIAETASGLNNSAGEMSAGKQWLRFCERD